MDGTLLQHHKQAHVSDIEGEPVNFAEQGSSDVWESHIYSPLATEILWDKSGDQYKVTLKYHGEESYAQIFIAAPETTITSSETTTAGTVAELGSVTYLDTELTEDAKAKNLIVVGGSCVNTVAAEILGGKLCGADFTAATGVGADQFLIKVVDSPYATGKIAMLVAGYEAADTKKAVTYVTKEAPTTDVDTTLKKVTATYADVE